MHSLYLTLTIVMLLLSLCIPIWLLFIFPRSYAAMPSPKPPTYPTLEVLPLPLPSANAKPGPYVLRHLKVEQERRTSLDENEQQWRDDGGEADWKDMTILLGREMAEKHVGIVWRAVVEGPWRIGLA
ncbi:hypothetical protein K461DRAFT_295175 [Myriangium duriaei CBS 260.36]|uniref:Uncharacterized protein n=1 Tax=Myriangium duriaei CBS 260.36 TaxID=1168546 RepID=A0A9P4MFF0_9PEZI|nr:hypothetical protein K461DRAFT_295175 [Myriangium duriaei CBS 260.36]